MLFYDTTMTVLDINTIYGIATRCRCSLIYNNFNCVNAQPFLIFHDNGSIMKICVCVTTAHHRLSWSRDHIPLCTIVC